MKKVLLLVGLILMIFSQAVYAYKILDTTKGNFSELKWEKISSDDGNYVWIITMSPNTNEVHIRFHIIRSGNFKQKDCFDFSSQTYFNNILCEEMNFIITTSIKKEPENTTQVKKFVNLMIKDL